MKPYAFQGLAALVCAAFPTACGGRTAGVAPTASQTQSVAALEQDAVPRRAYVGVEQLVRVGGLPIASTFDLLGGADVDLEIAARDGAPLRFELWQVHLDHRADLVWTVDASSGFALRALHADEDSAWLLRFPPAAPADVVVSISCTASVLGCTPFLQPGERCPEGWQCDQGLACHVPGEVCEPD